MASRFLVLSALAAAAASGEVTLAPTSAPTTAEGTFEPSPAPSTAEGTFEPSPAPSTFQGTFEPSPAPSTFQGTFEPSPAPSTFLGTPEPSPAPSLAQASGGQVQKKAITSFQAELAVTNAESFNEKAYIAVLASQSKVSANNVKVKKITYVVKSKYRFAQEVTKDQIVKVVAMALNIAESRVSAIVNGNARRLAEGRRLAVDAEVAVTSNNAAEANAGAAALSNPSAMAPQLASAGVTVPDVVSSPAMSVNVETEVESEDATPANPPDATALGQDLGLPVAVSGVTQTAAAPGVEANEAACFPGEAKVGMVAVAEYESEFGVLHTLHGTGSFVTIEHEAGELRATGNHLLFNGEGNAKPADRFTTGDTLLLTGAFQARVLGLRKDKTEHGLFAPLTSSGTVSIDGVEASNYATVNNLDIPHSAMHASFSISRMFPSTRSTKTSSETINPLAYLLHRVMKLDTVIV